jgi:hypothetical protein
MQEKKRTLLRYVVTLKNCVLSQESLRFLSGRRPDYLKPSMRAHDG